MKTRSRGGNLVRTGLMLALFAAVVFAVNQFVPGARERLSHASAAWLGVALLLEVLACVAYVVLFQSVFSRPPDQFPLRRGAQIGLGELGGFAITPTGAGGPAVRIWGLRLSRMPWRTLIVRSISHGVVFNLPYVLAAAILGVGVSVRLLPGHAPVLTAVAPLAVVGVVLAIAALATWLAQRPSNGDASVHRWINSIAATVPEGLRDLVVVVRQPLPVLGSFGWWIGDCAALWAAFQAVGGSPPLSVLILAYMLGQLGNTLPLPGGVGGVEPLMLGIFSASGVDLGLAGAAVICYRAIALGVQGFLGVAGVVSLVGDSRARATS